MTSLHFAAFLLLIPLHSLAYQSTIYSDNVYEECKLESDEWAEELTTKATGPLVPCEKLSSEWFECEDVMQLVSDNSTRGCPFFGERGGFIAKINITCRVLPCIECLGNRQFEREVQCVKYNGYYFLTALIYSIFLGFIAIDRFYLGYSAIGIGKLLTLGGFGIWWIADIVLLLYGGLKPADDSEWEIWQPY